MRTRLLSPPMPAKLVVYPLADDEHRAARP
jgi:hypothetical protein